MDPLCWGLVITPLLHQPDPNALSFLSSLSRKTIFQSLRKKKKYSLCADCLENICTGDKCLGLCKCKKNHLGCHMKHIGWAQCNTLDRSGVAIKIILRICKNFSVRQQIVFLQVFANTHLNLYFRLLSSKQRLHYKYYFSIKYDLRLILMVLGKV